MQIDLTWNSFLTPLLITALGFFVKKWINDVEKKADERSTAFKEDVLAIRTCVSEMKKELAKKVSYESCEKRSDDKWRRIYGHYHEVECGNPDCAAQHTGNVIVPHDVI